VSLGLLRPQLATGNWQLATGSEQLETSSNWRLAASNWPRPSGEMELRGARLIGSGRWKSGRACGNKEERRTQTARERKQTETANWPLGPPVNPFQCNYVVALPRAWAWVWAWVWGRPQTVCSAFRALSPHFWPAFWPISARFLAAFGL